jgi:hypothetical protein
LSNARAWVDAPQRPSMAAGMLMNVGSYVITPQLIGQMMEANRAQSLAGEVFFFYEGLRKNNNALGAYLKTNYYKEKATIPGRPAPGRRYPGVVSYAGGSGSTLQGAWSSGIAMGHRSNVQASADPNAQAHWTIEAPESDLFDLYVFIPSRSTHTDRALYTIKLGQTVVTQAFNQAQPPYSGWNLVQTVRLQKGETLHLSLQRAVASTDLLIADALMLLPHRSKALSVLTSLEREASETSSDLLSITVAPNPFNPSTTLRFELARPGLVHMEIFNVLGQSLMTLTDKTYAAGSHELRFDATGWAAGRYLVRWVLDQKHMGVARFTLLK